jgi:transposase
MLLSITNKSLLAMVNLLADCAYTGQSFADGVAEILGAKLAIVKRNELHTFKVM